MSLRTHVQRVQPADTSTDWPVEELRRGAVRPHRPGHRDRALGQHRLRAAERRGHARRRPGTWRSRRLPRGHRRTCGRDRPSPTSSGPPPRTPSTSPRPTRRSRRRAPAPSGTPSPPSTTPPAPGPTPPRPTTQQAFSADVAADATYAMEQVVQSGHRLLRQRLGRPAAGKTGTTNGNNSAWFAGFTPNLAASVALFQTSADGKTNVTLDLGRGEVTGGTYPVRIWTAFMRAALDGVEEQDFPARANVGVSKGSTSTSTSSSVADRDELPDGDRDAEPTDTPTDSPTGGPTDSPTGDPTGTPTSTPTGRRPAPALSSAAGSSPASSGAGGDGGRRQRHRAGRRAGRRPRRAGRHGGHRRRRRRVGEADGVSESSPAPTSVPPTARDPLARAGSGVPRRPAGRRLGGDGPWWARALPVAALLTAVAVALGAVEQAPLPHPGLEQPRPVRPRLLLRPPGRLHVLRAGVRARPLRRRRRR